MAEAGAGPNTPVGVDPSRASIARMYDFVLGGKDHYRVDRDELARLQQVMPEVADLALENRRYLIRVCRFLAERTGIDQYLDCGSGLPTTENVHQVVQRVDKLAKVVYVDNDPVVVAHGQALLAENDRTRFVAGDIFDPRTILQDEVVREHLDWSRPIALMFVATLHHYKGDRRRPAEIMREYVDALPSGSYVAISHLFDPGEGGDHDTMAAFQDAVARGSLGGATARTEAEIEELLPGLVPVEPGIVLLANWWSDGPNLKSLNAAQRLIAGVVARKP
ncbi:SAM-dependent methyltransferase [Amycolatopsis sp. NPDC051371]|uniref:SAM-dependent methyltransferase n=1 Tax=Amycolatopsis sp. NPDC051371 TaxID=3155800 RepID=UPI00343DEFC4